MLLLDTFSVRVKVSLNGRYNNAFCIIAAFSILQKSKEDFVRLGSAYWKEEENSKKKNFFSFRMSFSIYLSTNPVSVTLLSPYLGFWSHTAQREDGCSVCPTFFFFFFYVRIYCVRSIIKILIPIFELNKWTNEWMDRWIE